jgi:MEMO1 family protein
VASPDDLAIRPPAAAGLFYPADAAELAAEVDALLSAAPVAPADGQPRALVVPHAGYQYSGMVAAQAYVRLVDRSPVRVVLLGPAHFVPLAGCAVPGAMAWRTPLSRARIDPVARSRALAVHGVHVDDQPHAREHALEVQLPFLLQTVGADVPVLPVAAHASPAAIADLLDAVAAEPDALVVATTDLSHHLPEAEVRTRDARTVDAVLHLRPELIADRSACGAHALRGLLSWAGRSGLTPQLLAYATSAQAGANPDRVVGYAAFAFG